MVRDRARRMVRGSNEGQRREREREREGAEEKTSARARTRMRACVRACVRVRGYSGCRLRCRRADVAAVPRYGRAVAGRPPPGPYDMIYQPRLLLCAPSLPRRSLFVRCPVSSRSSIAADAPRVRARTLRSSARDDAACARRPIPRRGERIARGGEEVNEESR